MRNESHSYYENGGTSFVFRYEAPHYVVIDTGKNTLASGIKYLPRAAGLTGAWADVLYEGSDDGIEFTEIGAYKYPGTLDESVSYFGENVSYRYYRVKIGGESYAVGDELHLIKPKVNAEHKSVDIAEPSDISLEIGEYGKAVTSVYMDGELIDQGNYKLENGVFSLNSAYVGNLNVGDSSTATSWTADLTLSPPHYIEIEHHRKEIVSGFVFNPYSDANGFPLSYEIYIAQNDEYLKVAEGSYTQSEYSSSKSYTISFVKIKGAPNVI